MADYPTEIETSINDAHRLVSAALVLLHASGRLTGKAADPLDQVETLLSKAVDDIEAAVATFKPKGEMPRHRVRWENVGLEEDGSTKIKVRQPE